MRVACSVRLAVRCSSATTQGSHQDDPTLPSAKNRRATLSSLEAMGEPVKAINTLFGAVVEESLTDELRRGCLLVNTAVDIQSQTKEVQMLVNEALIDFRRFFARMIEHGKIRGEIASEVDSEATSAALLSMFMGIRVMARGAFEPETIKQIGAQAVALVTPQRLPRSTEGI